jgi:hypothetical protein
MAKDQNDLREMDAGYWQRLSDADKLGVLEFALMKLSAGANRVQVRHDQYWTQYGAGNVQWLRAEVQRLRSIVQGRRPVAINPPGLPFIGEYRPKNSTGFPPRY